jgi:hypothetical protein
MDFSGVGEVCGVSLGVEDGVDASPESAGFQGDFHVCIGDVGKKSGNAFCACGESVMPEYISFFIHYTPGDGVLMDI